MSIGSYQLFWNENQGGKVLTHNHFINKTEKSKVLMLLFPPKRRAAASSLHLSPPLWGSYPATLKWRPTASPIISHHPSSPLQCTMGWIMMDCVTMLHPDWLGSSLKHFGVQRLILHHLQSSHGSIDLDWMPWWQFYRKRSCRYLPKKPTTNKIEREIPDIRWLCYRKVKYDQRFTCLFCESIDVSAPTVGSAAVPIMAHFFLSSSSSK